MATHMLIPDADAVQIQAALERFLGDAGCAATLLIDRGGESLATAGTARAFDMVSVAALAAGAFSSTAPLARLLGETEFSVLIHEGVKESLHVSTVDDGSILLAIFDERTTVGMVRAFARETSKRIGAILAEARTRPQRTGVGVPPAAREEARSAIPRRPA
jgi:predicted regulator of Ras-like GTPase activity (Roadblock/LC7/MglB family)